MMLPLSFLSSHEGMVSEERYLQTDLAVPAT